MKKLLIIQTSLNKDSKTSIVCSKALESAKKQKDMEVEILDLRDYDLQFCNWGKIETYNKDMQKIKQKVEDADCYILCYPIYNYSFSWVLKNFIDIFSHYMDSKDCSFITNSYSVRSFSDGYSELTKILWLHNNIQVILPMVHCYNDCFEYDKLMDEKVMEKIDLQVTNLCKSNV